jgi:dynein heavy chain, axonemal
LVEDEKKVIEMKNYNIQKVKKEADAALNEAMPILQEAQEAVNKLDNKAIDELKGFKKATPTVQFVLTLVYMLVEKTTKIAKVTWD